MRGRKIPGQSAGLAGCRVEKRRTAGHAVIEITQIVPVDADPVDHARFEVRDEELPVGGIERNIAERCACILATAEKDVGENRGAVAVRSVQFIDGSGAATRTPLTGHPIAAGAVKSKRRSCRQVDVGPVPIIERNPEDLTGLSGRRQRGLRNCVQRLACRRRTWSAKIDQIGDRAIDVDAIDWLTGTIQNGGDPGKTRDNALARFNTGDLGFRHRCGKGWGRHHRCQQDPGRGRLEETKLGAKERMQEPTKDAHGWSP